MKKKIICFLSLLLGLSTLTGCGNNGPLKIELIDGIMPAYVGEEYDFKENIVFQADTTYSLKVFYQNYYESTEHELEVDGFKFTPTELFDLSVVITANRKNESTKRTVNLPVEQRGDAIDELLTIGYASWADDGFIKNLNMNKIYIHDEDSKSSVCVSYNGNNPYIFGGAFFALHNFRCHEFYKDKSWEDTILTFWVYNPTDYNLHFELRIKDNYMNQADIDYGQGGNIHFVAEPLKWSHALIPLRRLGITHTLIEDEHSRNDQINLKVRWDGTPTDEFTPPYNYQFYVDGIDFVPSSDYPEIETRNPDPMDKAVLAQWIDPPLEGEINYKEEYVKDVVEDENITSIKYSFDSKNASSREIQRLNEVGGAILTLCDPNLVNTFSATKENKWDNAIVSFWVYNNSDKNLYYRLRIGDPTQDVDLDWPSKECAETEQVAEPFQWTQIFFSLRHLGIIEPVILREDEATRGYLIVKMRWAGMTQSEFTFDQYIDRVDIVGYDPEIHKDIDTTMPKKPDHIDRLVAQSWSEDCLTKSFAFDEGLYVPECGKSSIKYQFNDNGHSFGEVAVCLNDPNMLKEWTDKYWDSPVIKFWAYSPDKELEIKLRLQIPDLIDIDWYDEGNVDFIIPEDTWTEIKIPLNVYGINFKVYKGTYNNVTRNDEMLIKAEHIGGSIKNDVFYIDGMDIIPNED